MIAPIATRLGVTPETATAIAGLLIIVLLLLAGGLLTRYAVALRPFVRGTPYAALMVAAFLAWFAADIAKAIGVPRGALLALFIGLLATRIVVELASPGSRRDRVRRPPNPPRSDFGGYTPGSSTHRHDLDHGGGHGDIGGGNGGGGGD
ncbi:MULTISPECIES: hypothetical protein [Rhodomicrobium]|uniref:hypothetical protein n=1 Tax=Rhodomicrobium TaxID=1068 RepID=UPI000B4B5F56|nr:MULTISPECIES: hypothetical protein [Rhodomicrobium]